MPGQGTVKTEALKKTVVDLDAFGYLLYGLYHLAMKQAAPKVDDKFATAKAQFCDFYFAKVLPRADALLTQVQAGDEVKGSGVSFLFVNIHS